MTAISKRFVAPALPTSPVEYDQRQQDQVNYALRLYFNLLDNYLSQLNTLLNNGGPFDSLTADEFIGGTFTGGGINGSYIGGYGVGAKAMLADGMINKSFVGSQVMAENVYANNFYGSGRYIYTPYNQFESRVDQTATSIGDANALKLEVTDFQDDISITGVNNTRITFAKSGIYAVTYSLQFKNTDNDGHTIDIWIRYNGSDYAYSNTSFFIPPRKSTGDPAFLVAVTTITGDAVNDNDYIEIMWRPSSTAVTLDYLPAVSASPGVTPAIPATPSAIVQAYFISAQFPQITRVAPAPVFGFGEIGNVIVTTNRT